MNKTLAGKIDSIQVIGDAAEIAYLDAELKVAEKRIAELESALRAIMAHHGPGTLATEDICGEHLKPPIFRCVS